MKFFRDIPTDDQLKKIIGQIKFNLSDSHENNFNNSNAYMLAEEIFDLCHELLPDHLIRILKKRNLFDNFKKDIIEHVVFNTIASNYIVNDVVISNHQYTIATQKLLSNEIEGFNNKDVSNLTRNLRNNIGEELGLPKIPIKSIDQRRSKETYKMQHQVSKVIAPFVFYQSVNYKGHGYFNKSISSKKRVQQLFEYIDLYKYLLNEHPEHEKRLNYYLFERHYNISLSRSILSIDKAKFIDYDNARKVLCMASLLPNVSGRLALIELLVNNIDLIIIKGDEVGFVDSFRNVPSQRLSEALWFERVPEIITRLALVAIPTMETIHSYLYNHYNYNQQPSDEIYSPLFPNIRNIQETIYLEKTTSYLELSSVRNCIATVIDSAHKNKMTGLINIDIHKHQSEENRKNVEMLNGEINRQRCAITDFVFNSAQTLMSSLNIPI